MRGQGSGPVQPPVGRSPQQRRRLPAPTATESSLETGFEGLAKAVGGLHAAPRVRCSCACCQNSSIGLGCIFACRQTYGCSAAISVARHSCCLLVQAMAADAPSQADMGQALCVAAEAGDATEVGRLLAAGARIHWQHVSAALRTCGSAARATEGKDRGECRSAPVVLPPAAGIAPTRACPQNSLTAMEVAVGAGHVEVARVLLDHGAYLMAMDYAGSTASVAAWSAVEGVPGGKTAASGCTAAGAGQCSERGADLERRCAGAVAAVAGSAMQSCT